MNVLIVLGLGILLLLAISLYFSGKQGVESAQGITGNKVFKVSKSKNITECDPHSGCSDTQLGALRESLNKRVNPDRMRHSTMSQVVEIAEVVMGSVSAKDLPTMSSMESPTNYNLAFNTWKEFTEKPDVYGAICGDIQIFAGHAFAAYGLETRNVSMFKNVDYSMGSTDNHASTEVRVHDRWVAVDLTFGMYFEGLLSWSEAREKFLKGETVTPIFLENGLFELEDYYAPLDELVTYMAIAGCPEPEEVCLYGNINGKSWDGMLNITKGAEPFDWRAGMITHHNVIKVFWTKPI